MPVFTARHITAHRVNRDIFVPQHHPGDGFNFHLTHAQQLHLGKAPNLRLRIANVVQRAGGQGVEAVFNFHFAQAERGGRPGIELLRIGSDGSLTALLNVQQYVFDGGADLRVIFALLGRRASRFKLRDHGVCS